MRNCPRLVSFLRKWAASGRTSPSPDAGAGTGSQAREREGDAPSVFVNPELGEDSEGDRRAPPSRQRAQRCLGLGTGECLG